MWEKKSHFRTFKSLHRNCRGAHFLQRAAACTVGGGRASERERAGGGLVRESMAAGVKALLSWFSSAASIASLLVSHIQPGDCVGLRLRRGLIYCVRCCFTGQLRAQQEREPLVWVFFFGFFLRSWAGDSDGTDTVLLPSLFCFVDHLLTVFVYFSRNIGSTLGNLRVG